MRACRVDENDGRRERMTQPTSTDTNWVTAALERHERPLAAYAFRILGDAELARDVVQDTFLKLCHQKESEIGGRVTEWLYTVCRNRAVDIKRRSRGGAGDFELDAMQQKSGEPPLELLEREESISAVRATLQKLTPREQEVLRLRFQGGLSYKEISNVTNQSVSHVGFLIHSGIQKLREKLTKTQVITRLRDIQQNPRNGATFP